MDRKNIEKQNVLEQVETVSLENIIGSVYASNDYDNIYEHFVTDKAYHTGYIPNKDIYALLEECYMDWFFLALHQNIRNMEPNLAKCYSQLKTYRDFHPSNMKGKDYFHFFKTHVILNKVKNLSHSAAMDVIRFFATLRMTLLLFILLLIKSASLRFLHKFRLRHLP